MTSRGFRNGPMVALMLLNLAACSNIQSFGAFGWTTGQSSWGLSSSSSCSWSLSGRLANSGRAGRMDTIFRRSRRSGDGGTELRMVFDFFRKRAEEGVEQLSNLGKAASEGQLGRGLVDVATYTKEANEAFAAGLAKTRNQFLYNLENLVSGDGDFLEQLEDLLLTADLGFATTDDILQEVRSLREGSTRLFSRDDIRSILRGKLVEALDTGDVNARALRFSDSLRPAANDDGEPTNDEKQHVPTVWFIMGANGMGKTTTIGKLAYRLRTEGDQRVLVAACDTFRAGAVEQLEMWAERAEVDCFSPKADAAKSSPASVLYGALDRAVKDRFDVLLVDTSGRLANNDALTAELLKMKRLIQKRLSVETDAESNSPVPNTDVPHETLMVIDAAQGRMALDSARQWDEELGLSGLILTKLDGSARGGSVVAITRELKVPIKLVGVGEKITDLRDFDPDAFVDGLLGVGSGVAAGQNDKKVEAKEIAKERADLAKRLQEMRKDRDARAKGGGAASSASATKKRAIPPTSPPSSSSSFSSTTPAGEFTFEPLDLEKQDYDDDFFDEGEFDGEAVNVITAGGGGGGATAAADSGKAKKKGGSGKKKKKKKSKR